MELVSIEINVLCVACQQGASSHSAERERPSVYIRAGQRLIAAGSCRELFNERESRMSMRNLCLELLWLNHSMRERVVRVKHASDKFTHAVDVIEEHLPILSSLAADHCRQPKHSINQPRRQGDLQPKDARQQDEIICLAVQKAINNRLHQPAKWNLHTAAAHSIHLHSHTLTNAHTFTRSDALAC